MAKKRHPEITRREFMGSTWKLLNVGAFIALGGHLGSLVVTSVSSGHPDSLTCYECRACASPCPWKLDPSGYLVAARVNNPDRRMLAQYNIKRYNRLIGNREEVRRMTIKSLENRDQYMKVVIGTKKDVPEDEKKYFSFSLDQSEYKNGITEYDEFKPHIVAGQINEKLREAFEYKKFALPSDAEVISIDDENWEIKDGNDIFEIKDMGDELSIKVEAKEYDKLDPMRIEKANKELEKLRAEGKDAELTDIYEMRAKDSAFYDPLCARCEPVCPVALPITKFIRDVKVDGKYR